MAFSRKMYTNEDLLVAAAAVKATWGQSARPHYLLSSEMARLLLKRTDTSRVRVGTILPTGTGQWTRQHQFWQCQLAYSGTVWTHPNVSATLPHLKSHTNYPDTKPWPNSVVVSQKWVTQHCLQPSTRHSSLVVATQICLSLRPVHSSRRQQSLVITRIWNATDGTILYWTLEQEACWSDGSCQYVCCNFFYRRQWAWSVRRRYIWYATDTAVAGCLAECKQVGKCKHCIKNLIPNIPACCFPTISPLLVKINLNFFLCTLWRHMGEKRYSSIGS